MNPRQSRGLELLVFLLLPELWACRVQASSRERDGQATGVSEARAEPAGAGDQPEPKVSSSPGAWRNVAPADLDRTLFWLSHVLIRHAEVSETQVTFNLTGWQTAGLPPPRSRQEARLLAEQVAKSAREGAAFDELARRFSDEPETAERGGSLGAVIAGHLTIWPQVLDAVAQLKPGEVSNVVETDYGYHVLQRRPPARQLEVSGSHIVIAHAAAPWLKIMARAALPERSREEAKAVARSVFERLRSAPNDFAALASELSDHQDAVRGGDLGSWSTHEVGYAREMETLATLEVGEVAAPIDTLYGYQILRRTESRPRQRYAMTKVAVRFDEELPESEPGSVAAAARRIDQLMQQLKADPGQFAALQKQVCCRHVFEVFEGRQGPALDAALARLAPGEMAAAPIRDGHLEYLIPMRLPLDALPARLPMLVELPVGDATVR